MPQSLQKEIPFEQTVHINQPTGKIVLNDFRRIHASHEDTSQSQNVKLGEDDKKWLISIANAVSSATGNDKYGASTVAREAVQFYRAIYHMKNKLLKYEAAVFAMLEKLP
jgi:hypothetical protein